MKHLVNLRVYFDSIGDQGDGPLLVDTSPRLETALASELPKECNPSVTVVPVCGMHYIDVHEGIQAKTRLALQATFVDPLALQTELWIRQGRAAE
jgi:hypothetical protein